MTWLREVGSWVGIAAVLAGAWLLRDHLLAGSVFMFGGLALVIATGFR